MRRKGGTLDAVEIECAVVLQKVAVADGQDAAGDVAAGYRVGDGDSVSMRGKVREDEEEEGEEEGGGKRHAKKEG